jgi:ribosomal subunit interface protein
MKIQVNGKHVDVGDALRERISTELSTRIAKYFERGGDAEVMISKEGHMFKADCLVKLKSTQTLVAQGTGADAHAAFDDVLAHIEARIRRYKRRLKNHHAPVKFDAIPEFAPVTVLKSYDDHDDEAFDAAEESGPLQPIVIAETQSPIKTMTVSAAVLEMDMSNYPVILFRNAGHGGLSVVYRRPDGHIGWIDPQRTLSSKVA